MATMLTLDRGLDFDRVLPGEPVRVTRAVAPAQPAPELRGPRRSRTLDDVVVGAWEELLAARPAGCPVCGGAMAPRAGTAAGAGGRCGSCETVLG